MTNGKMQNGRSKGSRQQQEPGLSAATRSWLRDDAPWVAAMEEELADGQWHWKGELIWHAMLKVPAPVAWREREYTLGRSRRRGQTPYHLRTDVADLATEGCYVIVNQALQRLTAKGGFEDGYDLGTERLRRLPPEGVAVARQSDPQGDFASSGDPEREDQPAARTPGHRPGRNREDPAWGEDANQPTDPLVIGIMQLAADHLDRSVPDILASVREAADRLATTPRDQWGRLRHTRGGRPVRTMEPVAMLDRTRREARATAKARLAQAPTETVRSTPRRRRRAAVIVSIDVARRARAAKQATKE